MPSRLDFPQANQPFSIDPMLSGDEAGRFDRLLMPPRPISRRRRVLLAVCLVAWQCFIGWLLSPSERIVLALFALPGVVYGIRRFGLPGAILTTACVMAVAIWQRPPERPPTIYAEIATTLLLLMASWSTFSWRQAARLAKTLSRTDELTGLFNRRGFEQRLEVEVNRARRSGMSLAVVYIDCDDFKQWNDRHGHASGDEVLQQVGSILCEVFRGYDTLARVGGDEFVALLPVPDWDSAVSAVERMRQALTEHLPISCSTGVAWFDAMPDDPSQMVDAADRLMYGAKERGRGELQLAETQFHRGGVEDAG